MLNVHVHKTLIPFSKKDKTPPYNCIVLLMILTKQKSTLLHNNCLYPQAKGVHYRQPGNSWNTPFVRMVQKPHLLIRLFTDAYNTVWCICLKRQTFIAGKSMIEFPSNYPHASLMLHTLDNGSRTRGGSSTFVEGPPGQGVLGVSGGMLPQNIFKFDDKKGRP